MAAATVYLFGDSVARGIVLDETGSYAPIKESFASMVAEKLGIDIVNKARFGCTIGKGLELVRRFFGKDEFPKTPGTIALMEFGGNDCDFRWDEISRNPEGIHVPATPLADFSRMYRR